MTEREAIDLWRKAMDALLGVRQRTMVDGLPCYCAIWPDENAEKVKAEEGHCDVCTTARGLFREEIEPLPNILIFGFPPVNP